MASRAGAVEVKEVARFIVGVISSEESDRCVLLRAGPDLVTDAGTPTKEMCLVPLEMPAGLLVWLESGLIDEALLGLSIAPDAAGAAKEIMLRLGGVA